MSDTHNFLRYVLTGKPNEDAAIGPRVRLQQHIDLSRATQLMALITVFNSTIAGYIAFSMSREITVLAWVATNFVMAGFMVFDFLRKVRKGESEPFYEKLAMHALGIKKLRF